MLDMKYYVLFYYVVADFLSRRAQYREKHLLLAQEANRRGQLILAGALADPTDGALLVFRASDRAVVEDFARSDPYVTNGLVSRWEVRAWAVVVGGELADASQTLSAI
jgi:uncharacterized protein YciI